jgi:membrane-bound ClpP family serine protease
MVITSAIGALLIIVGLVLFVVDLHAVGHGLLTAGGIVTMLAGGLLLRSSRCSWGARCWAFWGRCGRSEESRR